MKIESIPILTVLEAVRGRTEKTDAEIEAMSPMELVQAWCGWVLGDESWADEIIGRYEDLKEIEAKEKAGND